MLFSFTILFVAASTASAGATPAIGCQSAVAPPPCVPKRSQSVRPRGNPASWITTSDYPTADMRVDMQGTVAYRLTVGPNGRPTACDITQSSGFWRLDEATCRLVLRRARFCPATDKKAQPITGTWSSRMKWVIPEDGAPKG